MKKLVLVLIGMYSLVVNAQSFTNYSLNDIGIEALLADLIVDDNNNYWVTSWAVDGTPGIASFDGTTWQTYGPTDGSVGFQHRGVFQSTSGDLYFGLFLDVDAEGFEIFDGTSWTNYTTVDGLAGPDVFNFAEATNGDIWIATNNGLSRFDGTNFVNYGPNEGLTGAPREVLTDASGLTWLATTDGAFTFDGTNFTRFTVTDGLVTNDLFAVHQDQDGNYWFGGFEFDNPGVTRFDGTTFTTFTEVTDAIRKIESDSNGNIYFGGESAGLFIFDGTDFLQLTEADGLSSNRIRGIAENAEGNMVFSTWQGVSVYNPTLGIITLENPDFKIFPNPAVDIVKIQTDNFQVSEFAIYDALGASIKAQKVDKTLTEISLTGLTSGIYLLKFTNSNGKHIIRKIVKE
ncbi:Periplasmic ligand-binding sensor domain-containing protein [Marinirhabdus gelatinilytica]|uniref:Putative secreted protein (Por secretion system target) n=1 Tax=Marinirhabdus gelatinilytica TaxID=1703343 RepID=A0A370Q8V7_9FLAO|nr:T9SS type A sorting domain-containing protein [Marinirhabdus gelatinilytica]RDK84773.1 putative secreted protein (Por secretion system target) [Marinirhabdus gelatinilytica]